MSKLELSVNVNYLPNWGAWEGLRELIQNGKDAEVEFDAPLKITHYNGTLRIENEGATLSREALLFGTTSKAGRSDMIGKFGEGLKLGILALVRGGAAVKIRTGSEVWTAYIARSEKYDADVLFFDIKGGNEDKQRVRVEISGVSDNDWAMLKSKILFLTKIKKNQKVEVSKGDLLLDDHFRGQIFVKGIFVQFNSQLNFGYNFNDAEVDRDRKMIGSWDVSWNSSRIWSDAVAMRPDLLDPFFDLVSRNASDVAGLEHNAEYAPAAVKTQIAERFTAQFGEKAMPVATLAESAEVEHLGKRGVVVSKSLGAMLAQTLGSREALVKELKEEVTQTFSWSDLTAAQKANLNDAMALITQVRPRYTMDLVDVVEFRSTDLLGQHKDGRNLIAKRILDDGNQTLEVLVHEFSHENGTDGEKHHVATIEALWRDIVKFLRGAKS